MTPLRVLIIEDSQEDADLLLYELRRGGYDPIFERAWSKPAVEAALDRSEWQIILSDHFMPAFDAMMALSLVKMRGLDIPFIIVSGTIDPQVAVDAMKAGTHDYHMKDNLKRLNVSIDRELREAQNRKKAREAQLALKTSEEKFRSLVEELPHLIWTTDREGKMEYVNTRWLQYTGMDTEQSQTLGWQHPIHPDDRFQTQKEWQDCLDQGKEFEAECRLLRATDRMYRWQLIRAFPLHSTGETVQNWFGTCTDIQDQKKQADDLKRSHEELNQFAWVASHDLKEPLRLVTTHLGLLERKYKDKLDADAQESIRFGVEGARRIYQLIGDLLAFCGIELRDRKTATDPAPSETLEMDRILEESLENLAPAISRSGAQITHDALPQIHGPREMFQQVFQNLIDNAIKFHGDTPPVIHIGAKASESEWTFWVKDNGIGIDPQYREKIFLLFQRLHPRGKYPGTGIGLAICKKIVDAQGGKIWVDSVPGKGSVFYFSLPKEFSGFQSEPERKRMEPAKKQERLPSF
jgi:PAS domain S-box-containing protein